MTIRYEIILYWSEVDQAFIAEVPELPGCAADGETYQEVVKNAETVIFCSNIFAKRLATNYIPAVFSQKLFRY